MATVDLRPARYTVNMQATGDYVAPTGARSPVAFEFLSSGAKIEVQGSGITYDAAGRPVSGTATAITIDVLNDGAADVVITGVSAPAATLDDGRDSFWRFLEGADVFLLPTEAEAPSGVGFALFGDGAYARPGAGAGGGDVFETGNGSVRVYGDVAGVAGAADYRGGADQILGLRTGREQDMSGDADVVNGGRLTGGADSILNQSGHDRATAAGDANFVRGVGGAIARVIGGGDFVSAGGFFHGVLAGDVLVQAEASDVEGGRDRLSGGNLGERLAGDVDEMELAAGGVARLVGGDDRIDGNGGDDIIAGDLRLMSTPGGTVVGGDDIIDGGAGADTIWGDVASVHAGAASVTGGDDVIRGGGGNDRIFGDSTDNNQNTRGIGGDDRIYGDDGNDWISGQGGDDIVDGGAGDDIVSGGDGDDWVSGGGGADRLYGGAGADQMDGGAGADTMFGGAGNDTYYVNSLGDQVIESPGGGVDTVWTTLAALTLALEVENLRHNGGGAFWGVGNGLDNTVAGGWGADRLEGAGGDDVLIGSLGADALVGGAGVDTASYAGAFEGVDARLASGGYAGEALGDSYAGVENLIGSDFDDVLFGDAGANVLSGGDGSDWLRGEGGADVLRGGAGFDALDGGLGDDRFVFDRVSDSLPGARDVIQGFEGAGVAGGDVIDLSGIDADAGAGGNQAFEFGGVGRGQVSVIELGGNTLVRANVDGDAAFEFELLIEDGGVPASDYAAGDFLL